MVGSQERQPEDRSGAPSVAGAFVPVARTGELAAGTGKTCEAGGRLVAVFFDGQRYHAMDDLCPHMGASLGAGAIHDGEVVCPWHAWRFRASDGCWCDGPALRVEVFEVRLNGDVVEARIPPR
jgi:nitrite reductase (NADH) small subunit/3-phenylpropionate/trans-cinnamate dioxygenase ferredoxin subunit